MKKLTVFDRLTPFLPHKLKMLGPPHTFGYFQLESIDYANRSFFTSREGVVSGGRNWYLGNPNNLDISPVLRPWETLAKPLHRPGGHDVPAIEIAKLALKDRIRLPDLKVEVKTNFIRVSNRELGEDHFHIEIDKKFNVDAFYGLHPVGVANQIQIIRYLESLHFAVGFEEGEYSENPL